MTRNIMRIQRAARIAGALYVLQIPTAVFGTLYVRNSIVVEGDIAATIQAILAHEQVIRWSMVSAILCALVTTATALALYRVLKPAHRTAAFTFVLLTVIVAPIAIVNELNHVAALVTAHNESLHGLTNMFLELRAYGVGFATLFWGLWLLPLGYAVFVSEYMPKIIGVFLIIAGLGYVADFGVIVLVPESSLLVGQYTFIGEVMLLVWLLVKGVNEKALSVRLGSEV